MHGGGEGLRMKYIGESSQINRNNFNRKTWGKCVICDRGAQIFQKSGGHFKIMITRRVAWNNFHAEDPRILYATILNLLVRATCCKTFVHLRLGNVRGRLQDNIERDHQWMRIILKGIIRKRGDAVLGCWKHGNGHSFPINGGKFLDHPRNYQILKKRLIHGDGVLCRVLRRELLNRDRPG